MKTILFIILLIPSSIVSSQCSLTTLFPVTFFDNKFDTELKLLKSNNFIINYTQSSNGSWSKPKYLNGDSVFYSTIVAELKSNCINSDDIQINFVFADDKLYGIFLEGTYKSIDFEKCLSDYYYITKEIIKMYPNYIEVNVKDYYTKQKIGEAFKYYRSKNEKIKNIYTTVRVEYSKEKDSYKIEIKYKNFDKVKIDNRGFKTK